MRKETTGNTSLLVSSFCLVNFDKCFDKYKELYQHVRSFSKFLLVHGDVCLAKVFNTKAKNLQM